jgi:hypothetical protein
LAANFGRWVGQARALGMNALSGLKAEKCNSDESFEGHRRDFMDDQQVTC